MNDRKWTKEEAINLAMRLRWESMNGGTDNKEIIKQGRLGDRLDNYDTCAANLSRWLRHTEDGTRWALLTDHELDMIKTWIESKPVSHPDALCRLFPNAPYLVLRNWLTREAQRPIDFAKEYRVYRSSAIASGSVVVGSLSIDQQTDRIATVERYDVSGAGPKNGSYRAEGFLIPGQDNAIYLISRFENGDMQTAIFSQVQRTGHGSNQVMTMSGALINTMGHQPYATRIYCDEDLSVPLGTRSASQIPSPIHRVLFQPTDTSKNNVLQF